MNSRGGKSMTLTEMAERVGFEAEALRKSL
jgi:hypothetical protein